MSITSITSNAPAFQTNPPQNTVRQNFQQLSQSIQSGDLSVAQTAYASLIQNLPQQSAGNGNNPFQQAIASIGSALQSGDISGAQQTLQTMQSQMKGMHHHHHHHASGIPPSDDTNTSASSNAPLPPTASVGLYA